MVTVPSSRLAGNNSAGVTWETIVIEHSDVSHMYPLWSL